IASFSVSGLVPISAAIAGSEVAITVESMFSMNRAVATMSGIRRSLFMKIRGKARGAELGLYHPISASAIAEPWKPLKKSLISNFNGFPAKAGPELSSLCASGYAETLTDRCVHGSCARYEVASHAALWDLALQAVRLPLINCMEGTTRNGVTHIFCFRARF